MIQLLCTLLLLCQGVEQAPPRQAPPVLERVAVLGASASAGFNVRHAGETVNLAQVLDRTLQVPHETPGNFSSEWLFVNPVGNAKSLVRSMEEYRPTMIVALDFLFWFGYGVHPTTERRLKSLERGFQFLEGYEVPILISEMPDMSAAIGTMLAESQVPPPEALEKINQRLREWADERPNVHMVDLPGLVTRIQEGLPVTIREREYPAPVARRLIQSDHLHPTLDGLAGLAVMALDALEKSGTALPEGAVQWDPVAVAKAVREASAPVGSGG